MGGGRAAMKRETGKFVFLVFVLFLILTAFTSVSEVKTIYVPDNYAKIQWAVDNASVGDTIIVRDGTYTENVDVNKRLTIRSENGSENCIVQAADSNDHVFEVTADHVNISGFTVKSAGYWKAGIHLKNVKHCNILNNTALNSCFGIWLETSSYNNLMSNSALKNWCGICLTSSSKNNFMDNNALNNSRGILLHASRNNTLTNNTANSNTEYGILLEASSYNNLTNNIAANNSRIGIWLKASSYNNLMNNIAANNFRGILLHSSNKNNLTSNIANLNDEYGICLEYSISYSISNNNLMNNTVNSNNYSGIKLYLSDNNTFTDNTANSNNKGIYLYHSSNNKIYLNNFINNTDNVYSTGSTNIWNSTEKITYTYKGSTYTNYLGNYWSDYTGKDNNSDGIGDTPYSIDSDKDNYPLIEHFENYFLPTKIFNTGRPENPYPSISGKFVGTIRTNTTIIAKKLYTYACEGTGGHTEHAIICNSSWCAEAKWEGYEEDWMNISFNKTVILMPYETYNITIVTGSYPQIHHKYALLTENGWINCTEFTDANGNKYNNWIPAIMLWS